MSPDESGRQPLLKPGEHLGPYRVVRLLGSGGMGEVYAVVHEDLGSTFAIKRIHPDLLKQGDGQARFRREAQVLARLKHPNIVHVDDFNQAEGQAWLRMEWVEGGSLADRMRALKGSAMDEAGVRQLLQQMLSALDYAHAQGVVHRDLKPANILLENEGRVKLADFGLVRLADPDWLESRLRTNQQGDQSIGDMETRLGVTRNSPGGSLLGTFAYMSPEQKHGKSVGPQSDLYAVGLIAFQLLTGQESPGFQKPSQMNSRMDPAWDDWLQRAMDIEPRKRFRSARKMLDTLPDPERSGGAVTVSRPWRRQSVIAGLVFLAALSLLGAWHYLGDWEGHFEFRRTAPNGVVADETEALDERPVASEVIGAPLHLRIEPAEPSTQVWLGDYSGLRLDANGRVELERISPGSHELVVQAPGFQPVIKGLEVPASGLETTVHLVPIRGSLVLHSEPGVRVVATDADGRRVDLGTTDVSGMLESHDLLRIGAYELELSAPRRQSVEQSVVLPLGRVAELNVSLPPNPGELRLLTTPEGAEIWVRANSWTDEGESPLEVDGVPAEVELQVDAHLEGYRSLQRTLILEAEERRTVDLGHFSPIRAGLELRLESDPALDPKQLELRVNGERYDFEADRLVLDDLVPGNYLLEAGHPGFVDYVVELQLEDEDLLIYTVELKPLPGELSLGVDGPENYTARVLSNGEVLDSESQTLWTLPAREDLTLQVEASGWKSVDRPINLQPAESLRMLIRMEPADWPQPGEDAANTLSETEVLRLKWLEPGRFFMGSPESETGRYEWEGPLTRVELAKGFWMAQTAVTVGQFRAFIESSGYQTDAEREPERGVRTWRNGQWQETPGTSWRSVFAEREDYPVVGISWQDAQAFVDWLNERADTAEQLPPGYRYALPTEAQWEYAARAGTQTRWSFGDRRQDLDRHAWYDSNSGGRSHPVGQRTPNPWGLYDMHGNVWEWTQSPWRERHPGGQWSQVSDPPAGGARVYRGGSWLNEANQTRSAHRLRSAQDFRSSLLGFRIALIPTE